MPPAGRFTKSAAGLVMVGLVLAGCGGEGGGPAARVGTESIPDREVKALTDQWRASAAEQSVPGNPQPVSDKRLRQVALLQLIKTRLVAQLAAAEHVGVNADELAGALAAETSAADLDSSGWGKGSFESAMRSALLSKALAGKLFPVAPVAENRLRAYFDAHPDQFQDQWKATVDLAFFADDKRAAELARHANALNQFATTARDLGADDVLTSQAVNKASPLPSELLTVMATMKAGTLSQPVAAGRGFWVIRAVDVQQQGSQAFEAARPAIEAHLADQERQAKFNDWLAERLRSAKITVRRSCGDWPEDFL